MSDSLQVEVPNPAADEWLAGERLAASAAARSSS